MKRAIKIETASFPTRRRCRQVLFTLGVLAFCQGVQAVVPAPDGGYPGYNTAEGQNALFSRTTGVWNTALGALSLFGDTTGNGNTAVGINVLRNNVIGSFNTAVGLNALYFNNGDPTNSEASLNSAFGTSALFHNTIGDDNCAFGANALYSNTTGFGNTAVGAEALENLTDGRNNIALGSGAGGGSVMGNNNIYIGNGGNLESSTIRIGIQGVQTKTFIAGISTAAIVTGAAVAVDGNGQLGVALSSRRFKRQIKPMDQTSESILALKPVTFYYKSDTTRTPQFGLVAEEVQKVNPALVALDKEGKPYSVRYDQVNAMLLNEFLKEHRKVERQADEIQQQKATIRELKREMGTVLDRLGEQDSKIQKVSAQIEANRPRSQVVLNNP